MKKRLGVRKHLCSTVFLFLLFHGAYTGSVQATPGILDLDFGLQGLVITDFIGNDDDDLATTVAIQSDGKIVVGGTASPDGQRDFALVRYNADGTPDFNVPVADGPQSAETGQPMTTTSNGTSTANKIVWHSMVGRDDLVLVDRNCHKSILHAIIMTGAIPLYLSPERNELGIIGPIPLSEFTRESIQAKIDASPLARGREPKVKLAVVTNSTYDGLCYNAELIKRTLGDSVEVLHFDEAWYAYAAFHEFYAGRYGMGTSREAGGPMVFTTHSTHKLLAAFSQASIPKLRANASNWAGTSSRTALRTRASNSASAGSPFPPDGSTPPQFLAMKESVRWARLPKLLERSALARVTIASSPNVPSWPKLTSRRRK